MAISVLNSPISSFDLIYHFLSFESLTSFGFWDTTLLILLLLYAFSFSKFFAVTSSVSPISKYWSVDGVGQSYNLFSSLLFFAFENYPFAHSLQVYLSSQYLSQENRLKIR